MSYETRLLMYGDILGWKTELLTGDTESASRAMECVHAAASFHNERHRQEGLAREAEGKIRMNPIYLGVQYGAFSDNFAYSMPSNFGGRVLDTAARSARDLMRLGFLTRGAVVMGPLHHLDNVIYGPALIRAVEIEESEAFYPRILVMPEVVELCAGEDAIEKVIVTDQMGRAVVNPFALMFKADHPSAYDDFVLLNEWLPRQEDIEARIATLRKQGKDRAAEKWVYLRDFIRGPVFDADPPLRRHWK